MVKNIKNAETVYEADAIIGKKLNEENDCEYVQLSISKGKEIAAHTLPMPVTFYVLNGKAALIINDKQLNIQKGDLIEVKTGASRAWENTGNEELQLLAIKHLKL